MHVLIADDNAINRQFLRAVFESRGDQVSEAVDGREAIAACQRQSFTVVLMDIRMPEIDGIEATETILDQSEQPPVIIALTADLNAQEHEHLLTRGFAGCLTKPISKDELLGAVMRWVRGGPPRRGQRDGSSPGDNAPIDRQSALSAAGGNPELVDKLTAMLLRELDDFGPRIDQLIAAGDTGQARELVHKLRASTGYCGAKPLQNAAAALEQALKTNQSTTEQLAAFQRERLRLTEFAATSRR